MIMAVWMVRSNVLAGYNAPEFRVDESESTHVNVPGTVHQRQPDSLYMYKVMTQRSPETSLLRSTILMASSPACHHAEILP